MFCFVVIVFAFAELLRRPAINRTSKLIENVIETNNSESLRSYFEAGCITTHDGLQSSKKCMFFSQLLTRKFVDIFMLVLAKLFPFVLRTNERVVSFSFFQFLSFFLSHVLVVSVRSHIGWRGERNIL